MEETLTVQGLGLSARLQRSLTTINAADSLISRTRHVKRNVKLWRGGKMMLRGVAAGVLEAVKGFRRKGHRDMPTLVAKLRACDQQLGLTTAEEKRVRGMVHPGRGEIVVPGAAYPVAASDSWLLKR